MNVFNMFFGSFFRTLGRLLCYLLIGFIIALIMFKNDVFAEEFTQPERFQYFLYRNSDTPVENGTGLVDSYGGLGYNRVQWFYSLYTFDSNYLYDITFTTYYSGSAGTGVLQAYMWGNSCSISTGAGANYTCFYSGGYENNLNYMRISIVNMVGTDLSSLWLNVFSTGVSSVNLIQESYSLKIDRKENKNVTSDNLQNATDDIINNQNKNQQQTNEKLDQTIHQGNQQINQNNQIIDQNNQIISGQDEISDYLNDDTPPSSDISSLGNVQGLLPPGPVDSLLNIPFMFLSVITTSFGGVCKPITGRFVFDSTLEIPCFSELFYNNVPELVMNFINLIPSAFILITYFKHLYKKVDRAVSMNTNADDEWGVI